MTLPVAGYPSITNLAEALGLPLSRVWRRVKRLQAQGRPVTERALLGADMTNPAQNYRHCERVLDAWQANYYACNARKEKTCTDKETKQTMTTEATGTHSPQKKFKSETMTRGRSQGIPKTSTTTPLLRSATSIPERSEPSP